MNAPKWCVNNMNLSERPAVPSAILTPRRAHMDMRRQLMDEYTDCKTALSALCEKLNERPDHDRSRPFLLNSLFLRDHYAHDLSRILLAAGMTCSVQPATTNLSLISDTQLIIVDEAVTIRTPAPSAALEAISNNTLRGDITITLVQNSPELVVTRRFMAPLNGLTKNTRKRLYYACIRHLTDLHLY